MIPIDIFFRINSETDEKELLDLYNTIAKRINVLRKRSVTPKVEQKKEKIDVLIPKV